MRTSLSHVLGVVCAVLFASGQTAPPPPPPQSGTGAGAITGVVTDGTTRQPLANVLVSLSTSARGSSGVVLRVATDQGGRFVFTRLPAAPSYYLHTFSFGYFDGGYGRDLPATAEGRAIALADGEWFREAAIKMYRPGAIAGRVLDETGEPVVGVMVRVLPQVLVSGVLRHAAGPVVKTDDRGMYRIGGLAPARYVVSFPSVQAAVPAETPVPTLLGMTPERFQMASRIAATLEIPRTVAVDFGTNVVVGDYLTPRSTPDGRAQVYPPVFYPNARSIAEAALVDVGYGEEKGGIDLHLRPEATARVTGRVTGPAEVIAGLTLRLVPRGSEGLGIGSEAATALVGANGAFTMLHVPLGEYTLVASRGTMQYHYTPAGSNLNTDLPKPPAYSGEGGAGQVATATPGVGYSVNRHEGDRVYFARLALSVTAPDVKDVEIEMRPGATIRGRLVWESGSPVLPMGASGAGPGAAGPARMTTIPMYAEPADGDPQLGMPAGRYDPGTHAFEVAGLYPGLYRLNFWGVPFIKSIVWEGRDLTYEPFDASIGVDFSGVVITVTDQPATIEGGVRDESGNRVTSAAVLVFPTDRKRWTHYGLSPRHVRSTQATNTGAYKIAVPGGEYHVVAVDVARAAGLYDPAFLAMLAGRGADVVRVNWGETQSQNVPLRVIK